MGLRVCLKQGRFLVNQSWDPAHCAASSALVRRQCLYSDARLRLVTASGWWHCSSAFQTGEGICFCKVHDLFFSFALQFFRKPKRVVVVKKA